MPSERLIDDVAFATSKHVLEIFSRCIREEEHGDAFVEIYVRVRAAIECFEIQSNRMSARLHPSKN
jgi:hypothetical protein